MDVDVLINFHIPGPYAGRLFGGVLGNSYREPSAPYRIVHSPGGINVPWHSFGFPSPAWPGSAHTRMQVRSGTDDAFKILHCNHAEDRPSSTRALGSLLVDDVADSGRADRLSIGANEVKAMSIRLSPNLVRR
jgi:hypothetical protein